MHAETEEGGPAALSNLSSQERATPSPTRRRERPLARSTDYTTAVSLGGHQQ